MDGIKLYHIPRVVVLPDAMAKMQTFTNLCPTEIGGMGTVEEREGMLVVTDIFLLKQKANLTSLVFDQESLLALTTELMGQGRLSQMRCHWHSHVDSQTYFSSCDEREIAGWDGKAPWMLHFVLNKRRETRCRLDVFEPLRFGLDVPFEIALPINDELRAQCQTEVAEKVEKVVPPMPKVFSWLGGIAGNLHEEERACQ